VIGKDKANNILRTSVLWDLALLE